MTTHVDPKNTQVTTPPSTTNESNNSGSNFLTPSTVAMYNVLQLLFGKIAFEEGKGEIQMTKTAQETGVDLAHQMFTKGMLQAVGQGVAGLASLGGGIYSGYAMSSAGTGPEIDALENETNTIKGYQDALSERQSNTTLSDADEKTLNKRFGNSKEIEMDDLSSKPKKAEVDTKARTAELMEGKDLDLTKPRANAGGVSDKELINMIDDEKEVPALQGKMNEMQKEKSAELRDKRKMSFDAENMKSQAISTASQGVGQILDAGFKSGAAVEDKAQQLTSQALEMEKKSVENLDQDRKANAQTMAELQQLGQSIERARSSAAG